MAWHSLNPGCTMWRLSCSTLQVCPLPFHMPLLICSHQRHVSVYDAWVQTSFWWARKQGCLLNHTNLSPLIPLHKKKLNKAKQNLMGNWSNYNRGWMEITVTYLKHIFQNGNLLPFVVLKERFNLLPIHAFLLPAVAARC